MLRPGSLAARVSALGLLGIFLLAAHQFLVQPLLSTYRSNQDAIELSWDRLHRYQALVAEKPQLVARLEALASEDTIATAFLEGTSDALVAVELQDIAADGIERAGGEIRSTQSLPIHDLDHGPALRKVSKVSASLHFSTDIDGLAEALLELETGEPLLFVDSLQISTRSAHQPQQEPDSAPQLDVRMELHGYRRAAD